LYQMGREHTFEILMPHLPPTEQLGIYREALGVARTIGGARSRAKALTSLAPYLAAELWPTLLDTVRTITDEGERASLLIHMMPHLPTELLPEALGEARAFTEARWRVSVFECLVPHLPTAEQPGIYREALDAARAIDDRGGVQKHSEA
jgi:hypothetical protein